jgi:hypothetical protein
VGGSGGENGRIKATERKNRMVNRYSVRFFDVRNLRPADFSQG